MLLHKNGAGVVGRCREKIGKCPYGGPISQTPTRNRGVLSKEEKNFIDTLPYSSTGSGVAFNNKSKNKEFRERVNSDYDLSAVNSSEDLFSTLNRESKFRGAFSKSYVNFEGGCVHHNGANVPLFNAVDANARGRLMKNGDVFVSIPQVDSDGVPYEALVNVGKPTVEDLKTGDFLRKMGANVNRGEYLGLKKEEIIKSVKEDFAPKEFGKIHKVNHLVKPITLKPKQEARVDAICEEYGISREQLIDVTEQEFEGVLILSDGSSGTEHYTRVWSRVDDDFLSDLADEARYLANRE